VPGAQSLASRGPHRGSTTVRFGYGREDGVLDRFTLAIRRARRRLVAAPARQSTVVNVAVRFFDWRAAAS